MLKISPICLENLQTLILHRSYAVLLVSQGEGLLYVADQSAEVLSGRVFFLKRNLPVQHEGDMLVGHLIEFQEVMLHAFLLQFAVHRGKGLFDMSIELPHADLQLQDVYALVDLIALINLEMEKGTSFVILMHYLFLLLRHVNRGVEVLVPLSSANEILLLKLMILIEEHYKSTRKTVFYAEKLGIKPSVLNKFSREFFGLKLFDVLMERILSESDLLLLGNELSVKEIAYELGFAHPGHFNIYYTRGKGLSPANFRAKHAKN